MLSGVTAHAAYLIPFNLFSVAPRYLLFLVELFGTHQRRYKYEALDPRGLIFIPPDMSPSTYIYDFYLIHTIHSQL